MTASGWKLDEAHAALRSRGVPVPGRSTLERDISAIALHVFPGPWTWTDEQPEQHRHPYTLRVSVSPRVTASTTLGQARYGESTICVSVWGPVDKWGGRSPVWQRQLSRGDNHPDPIRWLGLAIRDALAAFNALPPGDELLAAIRSA